MTGAPPPGMGGGHTWGPGGPGGEREGGGEKGAAQEGGKGLFWVFLFLKPFFKFVYFFKKFFVLQKIY